MKTSKPSLKPHTASALHDTEDGWFYETRGGLEVVAVKGRVTTQVKIPWGEIVKAAVRCGVKLNA